MSIFEAADYIQCLMLTSNELLTVDM